VKAGATVEVNGRTFTGPINVFRNNTIREISFTPTGWDSQTSAVAMSPWRTQHPEGELDMTPEEIKALQDKAAEVRSRREGREDRAREGRGRCRRRRREVKAFEQKQAAKAKAKRDADDQGALRRLRRDAHDESAQALPRHGRDTFSAISKQMRETAKQPDPTLFEEQRHQGRRRRRHARRALAQRCAPAAGRSRRSAARPAHRDAVRMAKQQAAA
jgi:hypothetical protein